MRRPALSVVVPTYNRREILSQTLPKVLNKEGVRGDYEVVVVVDGSTDGTLESLTRLGCDPALRVVSQRNRGLSAARNCGAAEAEGGVVLFLDDDMMASPGLVAAHLSEHADGEERVVFGALPLAPGARRSFLKQGVEEWGCDLASRLSAPGYRFRFDDCHFGNASVGRELLLKAGGFDEAFVKFGNEDYDLGWRLLEMGVEMRFARAAVAEQIYDKTFRRWLEDVYFVGRADVALAEKHPALCAQLRLSRGERHPLKRLARWSGRLPADPLGPAWFLAGAILGGFEKAGARNGLLRRAQSLMGERQYWRGVRDARRQTAPGVRVEAEPGRVA